MTDTEKRDAVLKEYRIDRQAPVAPGITRITAGHDEERMAAEIVRLRAVVAALREPSIAMVQVIDDYIFRGAMTSDEDVQEAVRAVLAEAEREASA